jgi:uncharacterized membrane protein YkvA (DUF1232 family)
MAIVCTQCKSSNPDGAQNCNNCNASLQRESFLSEASATIDQRAGRPIGSILLALLCVFYLLNPTAGVFELLPDVLPIFGNLDEGVATFGLLIALNNMGIINLYNGKLDYKGWSQFISAMKRGKKEE